jgi:hypothetical protein
MILWLCYASLGQASFSDDDVGGAVGTNKFFAPFASKLFEVIATIRDESVDRAMTNVCVGVPDARDQFTLRKLGAA